MNAPIVMLPNFLTTKPKPKKSTTIQIQITAQMFSVNALTLKFKYLTAVLQAVRVTDPAYPDLYFAKIVQSPKCTGTLHAGQVPFDATHSMLSIAYSGTDLFTLPANAVLATIYFTYYGGKTDLVWQTENYIGPDGHMQSGCAYSVGLPPTDMNDLPKDQYYYDGIVTS